MLLKGSSPTRATPSSRSRIAARRPSASAGTRPSADRLEARPLTTQQDELTDIHPSRQRVALVLAIAAAVPALVLRATAPDLPHALEAALFGLAIVGAAFILSWAAEVAQLDISAGLAIAVLALIAVLPEYAVDFVFAWQGGNSFEATGPACLPPPGGGEESPCSLALANMTGANRLLIGIGWSMVVFIAWYRIRKRDGAQTGEAVGGHPARPEPLRRARVPGRRHDLLADPAAEALDHAVRRAGAGDDLRHVHDPGVEGAVRGAPSGRPRPVPGHVLDARPPHVDRVDVRLRGGRDPAVRGAVRARAWSRPEPTSASASSSWSSGSPRWRRRRRSC